MLLRRGGVDQPAHRQAQRIVFLGHAVGGELGVGGGVRTRSFARRNDARRNTHRRRTGRYRFDHHGIAAYLGAIPHLEATQNLGAGTYHDIAAQCGVALGTLVERGSAQRDTLIDGAAVTNFGGLAHHHPHRVVKENPLANLCTRVNFNAGQETPDVRYKTTEPFEIVGPEPMRPAVQHQRVQAGVTGQHLPRAAGSRVTVEDALNV